MAGGETQLVLLASQEAPGTVWQKGGVGVVRPVPPSFCQLGSPVAAVGTLPEFWPGAKGAAAVPLSIPSVLPVGLSSSVANLLNYRGVRS